MKTYYLAVDIGASSGRHILGFVEDKKIQIEEIYRFENKLEKRNGHLCWNLNHLFLEIKNGLKKCKEQNKVPVSMGIDTWAVDFVLLDEKEQVIGDTVGYRDSRTLGIDEKLYQRIPEAKLYERNGIQKQLFNTIYQLYAIKETQPEYLERAKDFLMIPEYFNFLLTGNKINEYTNATTTQLVDAKTKQWDYELMDLLGYPKNIFKELALPTTEVGNLTKEIVQEVGFDLKVVLPATHDTASAVISVPSTEEDCIYISSGTWSLMGTEVMTADCSEKSRTLNFTSEGGYDYRYRYLKNIMGLWMIQSVKKEYKEEYSFSKLCELAEENKHFQSRVDVNHPCFLAPDSMIEAVRQYCSETNQFIPRSPGEIAACIYQSLADSYGRTIIEIEEMTGKKYHKIYIIGGGSNADYLNQLTAQSTKKQVIVGPAEATAIGNLVAQMLQKDMNSREKSIKS
ncbi:MAG: rhamnulokinase [Lachnospiraceae bacterium]|nr:rhamnulokinase [Lachnospiraceae bacterium]